MILNNNLVQNLENRKPQFRTFEIYTSIKKMFILKNPMFQKKLQYLDKTDIAIIFYLVFCNVFLSKVF